MGQCLMRARVRMCRFALGGVLAGAVTFGAPAIAHADTPQGTDLAAVASALAAAENQMELQMEQAANALANTNSPTGAQTLAQLEAEKTAVVVKSW